jgi:shikimate kinase
MSNIILIGFMGSGKTTIGKDIASRKNMKFIDMDLEIEKIEKKSINEIFSESGEKYFREVESKLFEKLCMQENIVISTGGGIVECNYNIETLKRQQCVIWLDANTDTIVKHIKNEINKRPKLNEVKDLKKSITELLKKRYNKYYESANIRIDVNDKNVDQVASEILVYI